MSFPMFMSPSEIQKNIGMPEDIVWDCIANGSIGYIAFNDIILVETGDVVGFMKNRKTVADRDTYDYEDGYYEQDSVES